MLTRHIPHIYKSRQSESELKIGSIAFVLASPVLNFYITIAHVVFA
jgi:hypothetical protein